MKDITELMSEANELVVRSPEWYNRLKEDVEHLINFEFDRLLQLLYRVDVSESKLRTMLAEMPATDASVIITNLLLERQLEKIKSRKNFSSATKPPNEEEAW